MSRVKRLLVLVTAVVLFLVAGFIPTVCAYVAWPLLSQLTGTYAFAGGVFVVFFVAISSSAVAFALSVRSLAAYVRARQRTVQKGDVR